MALLKITNIKDATRDLFWAGVYCYSIVAHGYVWIIKKKPSWLKTAWHWIVIKLEVEAIIVLNCLIE